MLLGDLRDHSRADGATALADREPKALVHGDRLDQLDRHLDVVARHDHLGPLGEVRDPGHVGRTEVELRAVAREERRVAATLLLLQAVDLRLELGMRGDRPRLRAAPGRARSPRAWCRGAGSRRCRRPDPGRGSCGTSRRRSRPSSRSP